MHIVIFENPIYPIRCQLLVCFVGYIFDKITHFFPHLLRKVDSKALLQDIVDTALAGLTVDTDHIRIVLSSDIFWIDRKIRNGPMRAVLFFSPIHSLGNCILVRTGKCSEYKFSCIWLSLADLHSCQSFIFFCNLCHVGKFQSRIYSMREHIHCNGDDVYIPGTFSISKQCTFNPVSSCKNSKLCIADTTSPVIVRMQTKNHIFTIVQVLTHIFHLTGKHMRHGIFHRRRQIDDDFLFFCRLPHIQHRIAHIQRIVHFRSREAFRTILEGEIAVCLRCQFVQKLCTIYGNLLDFFLCLFEHLLSLRNRSRIIEMDHCMRSSLDCFKGFLNDMFPGLCQYLNRHIFRYPVFFDQRT